RRDAARVSREIDAEDRHEPSPPVVLARLATGAECSGSALAAELGVTRAAVWKQIERLRALGLAIRAEAGRGYALDQPFEPLDAKRIAASVSPALRARVGAIGVSWQTDSTSSALARDIADGAPMPRARLAEIQTRGRGRRGRRWRMPLGGGIALSFLRSFDAGMASLAGLSLVAGIAVVRALGDIEIAGAALKWPNDIVAGDRKLGGILVELGGDALGPCHAIVGIGINVRIGAKQGAAIDQPWTDLAACAGGNVPSRNALAGRVLSRLAEALDAFEASGFRAFADEYAAHDALRGRAIDVASGDDRWQGIASGITPRGALRVRRDGAEIELDSAEVSIRPAAGIGRRRA
ncbi:MAG TPA: biotin--[acetyl-CoA-carboxylase] ligase, partial [Rhodanobacteraceae bacterium]|nr:biotin--[acetyl-CoA-carboxylase] ligase [Rhodanobacteraceae bacterium]